MRKEQLLIVLLLSLLCQYSYGQTYQRIVSLSGSISEVLDAVGVGSHIVATDLTSDYPAYIASLPKVSKNRSVTIESLTTYRPDLVVGLKGEVSASLQQQLKQLKIPVVLYEQQFTIKGLQGFIVAIAHTVHQGASGIKLAQSLAQEMNALQQAKPRHPQKIMFVYARGAGHMSVAGAGTAVDAVIRWSGHINAMKGLSGYKTYNTEALVASNPDAILLFDFGISSLGGKAGILAMPGVALTQAGKNNQILGMDASLLNNFSVRLPQAIRHLRQLLK